MENSEDKTVRICSKNGNERTIKASQATCFLDKGWRLAEAKTKTKTKIEEGAKDE